MNHLLQFKSLKNRYFSLRHGEAKSNVLGILVSDPQNGLNDFGLTDFGKQQVMEIIKNQNFLDHKTIIYSSDFLRTKETAEIVQNILNTADVHLDFRLRERYFGDFEKMDFNYYQLISAKDVNNNAQQEHHAESILEVQDRITALVAELEEKYIGQNILLVSHGDPLQILEASFAVHEVFNHRYIIMPHKGELRELVLK